MQDWKMQTQRTGVENTGVKIVKQALGMEKRRSGSAGGEISGGKRRNGKCRGDWWRWKMNVDRRVVCGQ